ncbi:hypothetical protein HPX47_001630 [Vibrio alginolyticus]|nr:hypothetical protein [Vibrio alginolyticus]
MSYYMYNPFQQGMVVVSGNGGEPEPTYDFIMTVGKPTTSGYYGFSASYGDVNPKNWGNSETAEITMAIARPNAPYFLFTGSEMETWNDYANVRLKLFTDAEAVETTISNGCYFVETYSSYRWKDEQTEVSKFLARNIGDDVFVKVLNASLPIDNEIKIVIGHVADGHIEVWGYSYASGDNIGELISGEFHSGSAIAYAEVQSHAYGASIMSENKGEYWSGWRYMKATWNFEDGTSHMYAGRLLMHPAQGFHTSGVIDDKLIALTQNNIDKTATITLSEDEAPSNVIEIEIGEINSVAATFYGFVDESDDDGAGALISGEFPDASPVFYAYAGDGSYGCVFGGLFEYTYWNYQNSIKLTWEFEDGTVHEYPNPLTFRHTSSSQAYYESRYIDETLNSLLAARIGQTAKITVTEPETSKLLAHLQWELDEAAKA